MDQIFEHPVKERPVIIGPKKIESILPHRYPFLLVDKVIYLNLEKNEIIGQKNMTKNEQFFQGHFPEVPIMPGVLILEALAQTGGILVHQKGYTDKIAVLMNISEARFRKPIVPGDIVDLYVKALHVSNKGGKIKARALVGENVVAEAEITFALIDKNKL
jgi:3-hydroxyacyl-[acyl-carrier-protein] dehydratase